VANKNYIDILNNGKDLVRFYREHPCIAAYDLLNVDFAPIQRIVFKDMWFKNNTISVMGRGSGKTYMLGVLASLSSMLYPGYRVGLIGPVFRQSLVVSTGNNYRFDTFWTSSGLQTSTQKFYDSVQEGITKTQSLDFQNTILSKWKNPDRACRSIKTTKGFELAGTVDHGVVVLNSIYDIGFKDMQDLRYSDYIAIKTGFNYFGNNNSMPTFDEYELCWRSKDCNIPKEITPDLAYLFGMIVGDGCVTFRKNDKKPRLDFVNEDRDLLDSFHRYTKEYFGIETKEQPRRNNIKELQFNNKKLCIYLLKCGFTRTTALDKKVPDVIKKVSRENMVAFLQGLFDTDGNVYIQKKTNGCTIGFSTSSLQLAKEVHAVLLNLGIISNLGVSKKAEERCLAGRNKPSKCAEAYKIRITGQTFITRFNSIIGFRCKRKTKKLSNYLDLHFNREESLAKAIGLPNSIVKNNYSKCQDYYNRGLYFVKMVEDDYFFAPTIDVEVEKESCYWSSGFISHNSKMIFSEIEKLYSKAPLLREACDKRPTRGSDLCYLRFKAVGGFNASYVEALPLGDGNKIRGSRFYLVCLDELAQIPDKTLDMVIRPMGATTMEPMENVRRLERQRRLIAKGIATSDDFEENTVNKMVMTSSGYYKFNHMWRRMRDYWEQMERYGDDESTYSVHQVPYTDLPEGFSDADNIAEAKRVMSSAEFRMEYEAEMISDSEGFFKASLIEACTRNSGFSIDLRGDSSAKYIVGMDPNQGGSASCGVVIIRMGPVNRVANVIELKKNTTQDMTTFVQRLCENYNVMRIFVDKGGGGKAICDLLEDGYNGKEPIIDRTNEEHRHMKGRHILEMVNFNPSWISDANFTTLSLLEDERLKFPEAPISTLDAEAVAYESIKKLKSQMLNIIVTQTSSGLLHFDTPTKGQNKDLYSAIILAAHGVRMVEKELEGEPELVLHNSSGCVRMRNENKFKTFNTKGPAIGVGGRNLAVLHKKIK